MSSLLPRFGRRLAGWLVALLVGATALPPALHADMDDLACQFGAAASARSVHVDANDTRADSLHCEVCHWLRSIRSFELPQAGTSAVAAACETVYVPQPLAGTDATTAARSSRAPPLC